MGKANASRSTVVRRDEVNTGSNRSAGFGGVEVAAWTHGKGMKRGTAHPILKRAGRGSRAAEGLIRALKHRNGCGAKEPQSERSRPREYFVSTNGASLFDGNLRERRNGRAKTIVACPVQWRSEGEPDAVNQPVRFGKREGETESCSKRTHHRASSRLHTRLNKMVLSVHNFAGYCP